MTSVLPSGTSPVSPSPAASITPLADTTDTQVGDSPSWVSRSAPQGVHATLSQWSKTADHGVYLNRLRWAETELQQWGGWVARHDRLTAQPQPANATLTQALQQQLQQADERLQQGRSPLTVDLTFNSDQSPPPKVFIHALPLLQTKGRDETLQVGIPGKPPLQIPLPAEASPKTLLQRLKTAFQSVGITVAPNSATGLEAEPHHVRFSASASNQTVFFRPWQLSGEGVRVAAGNALIAPLQSAHSPLHALAKTASEATATPSHSRIIDRIKQTLSELRASLSSVTQRLGQKGVEFESDAAALAVSEKIKALGQSQSPGQWAFAHKHSHRKVVEFGLLRG